MAVNYLLGRAYSDSDSTGNRIVLTLRDGDILTLGTVSGSGAMGKARQVARLVSDSTGAELELQTTLPARCR